MDFPYVSFTVQRSRNADGKVEGQNIITVHSESETHSADEDG